MKFQINEVWKSKNGDLFLILDITNHNYGLIVKHLKDNTNLSFTLQGCEINSDTPTEYDLINCVGTKYDFPEYFL